MRSPSSLIPRGDRPGRSPRPEHAELLPESFLQEEAYRPFRDNCTDRGGSLLFQGPKTSYEQPGCPAELRWIEAGEVE